MLLPAMTGSRLPGSANLRTSRSGSSDGAGTTGVTVVALSDSSPLVAVAVLTINVPAGVPGLTVTSITKVALSLGPSGSMVAVTVPVPPTFGVVIVGKSGPVSCVNDTKVVLSGTVSVSVTLGAAKALVLLTVIV